MFVCCCVCSVYSCLMHNNKESTFCVYHLIGGCGSGSGCGIWDSEMGCVSVTCKCTWHSYVYITQYPDSAGDRSRYRLTSMSVHLFSYESAIQFVYQNFPTWLYDDRVPNLASLVWANDNQRRSTHTLTRIAVSECTLKHTRFSSFVVNVFVPKGFRYS